MNKLLFFTAMFSLGISVSAQAQNVSVSEEVFGAEGEIGTKTVQPSVNQVYKIDNVAKKKAELEAKKNKLENADETQAQNVKKKSKRKHRKF